jgi:hypothetical protein
MPPAGRAAAAQRIRCYQGFIVPLAPTYDAPEPTRHAEAALISAGAGALPPAPAAEARRIFPPRPLARIDGGGQTFFRGG